MATPEHSAEEEYDMKDETIVTRIYREVAETLDATDERLEEVDSKMTKLRGLLRARGTDSQQNLRAAIKRGQ